MLSGASRAESPGDEVGFSGLLFRSQTFAVRDAWLKLQKLFRYRSYFVGVFRQNLQMWRASKRLLAQKWRLLQRRDREGARLLCVKTEEGSPNVLDVAKQLEPGDKIHGYTVNKVVPVPELYLVSVQLTHNKTGAQHLHIARDDANNVFSVGFRTTPMDSTGVSHILEHTVLCGSEKFPCRDPFFKMLNRSLATFMNAFTACDFTMYPFSTQNVKDFNNLMSVYLDAVFFPRLRELDFLQEGWRLESEKLSDSESPLMFKGVVFNEMKGAMSTAESLFVRHAQRHLLPSHTYSHNSGGEPLDIPDLTWTELKEFHASHYHPSNARFYTYGDLPLESHLANIEDLALRHFDRIQTGTDIPHEPRWKQQRDAQITCPSDPMAADPEKQTAVSLHYLLGSSTDSFEAFTMGILSSLLISGPNSPFYQALIESNIGHDYSPGVGYDNGTKDVSFSIGLQGIKEGDIPRVIETIQATFDKVIQEGFPAERIEAILHTVELAIKHQSSNFGLGLISGIMHSWIHGADPVDSLLINQHVETFKERLENANFLQDKIEKYFKNNSHCLTFSMSPDADYEKEQIEKEKEKLAMKVSLLSDDDKQVIYQRSLELAEEQNAVQDVSCLPVMLMSDIDPKIKPVQQDHYIVAGVPVQFSEQPTNGMTYFRALSSITDIPEDLKPYLPLFCFVLTKMGAGKLDYREMSQMIEMRTGGLSVSPHVSTHHSDAFAFEQGLLFSSHCLDKNLPHMFYLWGEIFSRPTLNDTDRLRTLINMLAADLAMSIAHSGHVYASSMAASSLTPAGQLNELLSGISQVLFMKNIAEIEDLSPVIEKLSTVAVHVLEGTQFRCAVSSTADSRTEVDNALEGYCDSLASSLSDQSSHVKVGEFQPRDVRTHIELPFPVNYVSRCLPSVPYTHEDFARLTILAKLLSSKFLHREIREKGGAYGSGARAGGGVFTFQSYRDPNFSETLNAFDSSIKWATDGSFTDDDISEAKLAIFAAVDSPVSPANRGLLYFTQGITDKMRQAQRDRLFSVGREDLMHVASRYLATLDSPNSFALLGPENELTANENSWTIRKENLG